MLCPAGAAKLSSVPCSVSMLPRIDSCINSVVHTDVCHHPQPHSSAVLVQTEHVPFHASSSQASPLAEPPRHMSPHSVVRHVSCTPEQRKRLLAVQAKIITSQARRGANPARIVRALAYEAALRDPAGTTAQRVALSLGRLDPNPQPSFATSPRIGASRRITAPGEEAVGIWQMAPTSSRTPSESSPDGGAPAAAPPGPGASEPADDGPHSGMVPFGLEDAAESPSVGTLDSSDEDVAGGHASGELTAQAEYVHGMHAYDGTGGEASTDEGAREPADDAADTACAFGDAVADGRGAGGDVGGLADRAARADACVFLQRVPSAAAVAPPHRLAAAASLGSWVRAEEARRTTADSTCSREYGAGKWWRVDVDMDVEVPADDGFRVVAGRGAAVAAVAEGDAGTCAGTGAPARRGRRLCRAARRAAAGVVVVAATLMLRRRGNRK